jgi:DNA polymerase V
MSKRGGKRPGAGRPKKEPTTTIRVPVSKVEAIQKLIASPSKPQQNE